MTQKAELEKEVAAKNKEAEVANLQSKKFEEKLRLATIEISSLGAQLSTYDDKVKQVLRDKTALVAQNAMITKKFGDITQRHDQMEVEVSPLKTSPLEQSLSSKTFVVIFPFSFSLSLQLQKARIQAEKDSREGTLRGGSLLRTATPVKASPQINRQLHDAQRKGTEIQQLKAEKQQLEAAVRQFQSQQGTSGSQEGGDFEKQRTLNQAMQRDITLLRQEKDQRTQEHGKLDDKLSFFPFSGG